jgi:hypothetical protein
MKVFTLTSIIILYFFIAVLGPFSFHYENHKMGIMGPDCHQTSCINVLEDINIWHYLLSSFLPILKIILITLSFYFLFFNNIKTYSIDRSFIKNNNFIINYYQKLFSKGILNPKSP